MYSFTKVPLDAKSTISKFQFYNTDIGHFISLSIKEEKLKNQTNCDVFPFNFSQFFLSLFVCASQQRSNAAWVVWLVLVFGLVGVGV